MSILYFIILSYILLSLALIPVFKKAGVENSWVALIPGLNFMIWCDLIGRKRWWALLLLVPVINIFIFCGMAVDMARSFGYFDFWHSALAVIYAPAIFYLIGNDKKVNYQGGIVPVEKGYKKEMRDALKKKDKRALEKLKKSPYYKSGWREWVESMVFAVFAAAFIRMFLIEAYMIPTSSMEGSLLVGDHLFVSKANYGIRLPMTVIQVPLLHNRIPGLNTESYTTRPSLSYRRIFKFQDIKRNDPVVFNFPEGDSVFVDAVRTYSIYDTRRSPEAKAYAAGKPLTVRPIDKKDHYIKRCVGLPGDTLEIRNKQLFINGKEADNPENIQFAYLVNSGSTPINLAKLQELDINIYDGNPRSGIFNLNNKQVEQVKNMGPDVEVIPLDPRDPSPGYYFPNDPRFFQGWNTDNFGPIYIPKAGVTIDLTPANLALYRRVISVYEKHALETRDGKVFIDGKEAAEYTFEMDYFWMMGDNRHNSEDSRIWGFVPENHVVGKPLFIWLSTKNARMSDGIRWDRMFTSANKK